MNKQEAMETILGCKAYVMGQGVLTEFVPFEIVEDIIEKLDTQEVQKVVIPKFVVDWLMYARKTFCSLKGGMCFDKIYTSNYAYWGRDKVRLLEWIAVKGNQEKFASAWLNGYEVEKEQLYTVELPNPNKKDTNRVYLCKDDNTGKVYICKGNFNPHKNKNLCLTEEEIKKDFDWAWQFRKEL